MTIIRILAGCATLAGAVVLTGLLLPQTRAATLTRDLTAPPDVVRAVILDAASQPAWRAGVEAVEPGGPGTWTEIRADGERIDFALATDTPDGIGLTFASDRGYTGVWTARIAAEGTGTRLTVTEEATTPSPIGRILARLFFDPEAFAAAYLDDLGAETERRAGSGA